MTIRELSEVDARLEKVKTRCLTMTIRPKSPVHWCLNLTE